MNIQPLISSIFKNLPKDESNPVKIGSRKSLGEDEPEDEVPPEAGIEAAEESKGDEKGRPTVLEQYMAQVMSDIFGRAGFNQDSIFEKMRKLENELLAQQAKRREKEKNTTADQADHAESGGGESSITPTDVSTPPETSDASSITSNSPGPPAQTIHIGISVEAVFEKVEELIRYAGEERGGRVQQAASSVLRRQSTDLSLDFSFTKQFLDQGIDIAKIDQKLLEPFMDAAIGLAEFSDDSLQKFMAATQSLFNGLESELRLADGELQGTEDAFKKMAARFFDAAKAIAESPSLIDEEARQAALDVPPDDPFYRKRIADIFAESGMIDKAKQIVGNLPSDTDILLSGMGKAAARIEQMLEKRKEKKEQEEKKDSQEAEQSGGEFAEENARAVTTVFEGQSIIRASEFFRSITTFDTISGVGRIRDAVA